MPALLVVLRVIELVTAPITAIPFLNHWYAVIAGGVFGLAVRVTNVDPIKAERKRPGNCNGGFIGKGVYCKSNRSCRAYTCINTSYHPVIKVVVLGTRLLIPQL